MENNIIFKLAKGLSMLFIAFAVVYIAMVMYNGDDALEASVELQNKVLNPFMVGSYIALGLGAFLAIFFAIVNVASSPKNAVRGLIGVGIIVVVAAISYSLASNSFNVEQLATMKTTASESIKVGAALIATYIIAGIAVFTIIASSVVNFFK